MAQPNVAREPSMDEILASIRKIIESNEPGIPGFPANDIGAPSPVRSAPYEDEHIEDIRLTIDDADLQAEERRRQQAEAAAHAAQMVARIEAPVEAPAAETAPPPQSLADVAARVRAASERHASAARPADVEIESRLRPSLPLTAAHLGQMPETPVAAKPAESVAAELPQPEPVKTEATAVSVVEQQPAAIVSPEVGAQVARSFDDLALALDAGPRRSFDEIAQDMLRPMLQEWLDDNLPTLVERLVREEIERVARGPRRG